MFSSCVCRSDSHIGLFGESSVRVTPGRRYLDTGAMSVGIRTFLSSVCLRRANFINIGALPPTRCMCVRKGQKRTWAENAPFPIQSPEVKKLNLSSNYNREIIAQS